MKPLFTFLFLLCAACTNAVAQTTEADILKLEDRLLAAMLNNGVAELDQLTDQDLLNYNQFGERYDRARFITLFKTFKPGAITHTKGTVRIAGDTAIFTCNKREVSTSNFGQPQYLHLMHVWVKRPSGWKVITMQQQFDVTEGTVTPAGWTGESGAYFLVGTDTNVKHGGNASAFIKSKFNEERNAGTGLVQYLKADVYRGKRVRLSGWVKGTVGFGMAYPWMRVTADHQQGEWLSYDNRVGEGFVVRSDWTSFTIVLDVPERAAAISIGFVLNGRGHVWLDDWTLEVVENSVASTNQGTSEAARKRLETMRTLNAAAWQQQVEEYKKSLPSLPTAPVNLDFETAGKP